MVRKLAIAVALALGSTSMTAYGLGLGEIKTRSVLNQALDAEIDLLSVVKGEMEGLRVQLAPAEAFERAGLERPFYLAQLRFEPVGRANGRHVIKVTTEFPVREPFLNFLVEVNWSNGRLLREYTVLLDPPTTTRRQAPQVSGAAAARPASSAPQRLEPAADTYGPVQANDTLWGIAKQLRPSGVSMSQMMIALLQANPQAFLDNNVNRLRRGQILRVPGRDEILKLSRAEAHALYREQQDAWLAARAPVAPVAAPADAATEGAGDPAVTPEQAADRLRIATAKGEAEVAAAAGKPDGEGAAAADLNDQLLLARENAETSRLEALQLRSRVDDLRVQLEDMQRLLTLKNLQLARLQGAVANADSAAAEVAAVEAVPEVPVVATPDAVVESLATPDAVATAGVDAAAAAPGLTESTATEPPSDQLAGLEPPPEPAPEPAVEAAVDAPAEDLAAPDAAELNAALAAADETAASMAMTEDAAPTPEELGAEAVDTTVPEVDAAAEAATVAAAPPEPVAMEGEPVAATTEAPPPLVAEPVVAPTPAPAAELSGEIESSGDLPLVAGGVAAVAALGALFGLVVARRNRRESESATLAPVDDLMATPPGGAAAAAAGGGGEEQDSALLSELTPSDLDELRDDTNDVDPVSEADVYIAYGRYQQAEQLLQQAMQKDPHRLALPHKLLEVYYAMRRPDAFVGLAGEMMADGRDQADAKAWGRAKEMGRDLAPENPMFTVVAGVAAGAALGSAAANEGVGLEDLELSELASEIEGEQSSSIATDDANLDVDGLLDLDTLTRELESQAIDEDSLALDDLETFDLDVSSEQSGTAVAAALQQPSADDDLLDLSETAAPEGEALGEDSVMNFDPDMDPSEMHSQLDDLSDMTTLDAELAALGADTHSEEPLSLDAAVGDEGGDETESVLELDTMDGAAASGEDEVDTKIDLARAYVEMGDAEGARSILAEVEEEGTAAQQAQARDLLEQLPA